MLARMRTDVTSVLSGRLPDSSTNEPYSLTARAKLNAAPAAIAGVSAGRVIRRNVVSGLAPSEAAASSASGSSCSNTGCTARTTNGNVTNKNASATAGRWLAMSMPIGVCGPYSDSSTNPATIVGSANGMSINTSSTRLPTKSSRTSTQAIRVPITTLITVTSRAAPTVRRIAANVCSLVIARQN